MSRTHSFIAGSFLLALLVALVVLLRAENVFGPEEQPEFDSTDPVAAHASGFPKKEHRDAGLQGSFVATASLCGVVIAEGAARPSPAALVALRGPQGSVATRVNEHGAFCFDELSPGSYDVAAHDGDRRSKTLTGLLLRAGDELDDLALVLRSGTWVSGRVVDRRGQEAVKEARVLASCASGMRLSSAVTDRHGEFVLRGVPPGQHLLTVAASGFSTVEMMLDVPGRRPVTGVSLVLDRLARVRGRVEDARGHPVGDATVRAVAYQLRERPAPVVIDAEGAVRTEADGSFEVEAPSGLVTLHASATGHGPGRTTGVEVGPGALVEGVTVRLSVGAGLVIDVIDSTGKPASKARVRAFCDGMVLCGAGFADATGRFVLTDLVAGRVQIDAAAAEGTGGARLSVDVAAGVRRHLTIALSNDGVITGVVVNDRNQPFPEALLVAFDSSGVVLGQSIAGRDGSFHMYVPADARLTLQAQAESARAEKIGLRAGDEVRMVLHEPGGISGYVTNQSGRAMTDFTVTISSMAGHAGSAIWRKQRFASEGGDFAFFDLPPGGYRLQAFGPGNAAGEEVEVRVWPKDETGPVGLRVSAAGSIRGRVLGPDGEAVAAARVAVDPARLRGLSRWSGAYGSAVKTDAAGAFMLEDVPAGEETRVYSWHPELGAAAGGPVFVEAGQVVGPVKIRLRPRRRGTARPPQAFGGVGMTLVSEPSGAIRVGEVFAGGPAFLAGLQSGDRLVTVDGLSIEALGLNGTLSAIRGPVGTDVILVLEGRSGDQIEARLVRVELQM